MVTNPLVVPNALGIETRRRFLAAASNAIETAQATIEVDCSLVVEVEAPIIGMLVSVTRQAQRRGIRVVLVRPSSRLCRELDETHVSPRFEIRP